MFVLPPLFGFQNINVCFQETFSSIIQEQKSMIQVHRCFNSKFSLDSTSLKKMKSLKTIALKGGGKSNRKLRIRYNKSAQNTEKQMKQPLWTCLTNITTQQLNCLIVGMQR